jgi:hypothetical protein
VADEFALQGFPHLSGSERIAANPTEDEKTFLQVLSGHPGLRRFPDKVDLQDCRRERIAAVLAPATGRLFEAAGLFGVLI